MLRRLLSLAVLLALLVNVSGAASLAHERAEHRDHGVLAGSHDDAHCVVCQAIAAARTVTPPPLPSVVDAPSASRDALVVAHVTPTSLELPASRTSRGPPV